MLKEKNIDEDTFVIGDEIIYPTHGLGVITSQEKEKISGIEIEMFVIRFEHEKMTLRVPIEKAHIFGMRHISNKKEMKKALLILKTPSNVKRTMWSRRAQEYETKLNSGDPILIAEVLRDLNRSDDDPEQSYSERQLYEEAFERLVREMAAVEQIDEDSASKRLESILKPS